MLSVAFYCYRIKGMRTQGGIYDSWEWIDIKQLPTQLVKFPPITAPIP